MAQKVLEYASFDENTHHRTIMGKFKILRKKVRLWVYEYVIVVKTECLDRF